jgi:hypothetical protein
MKEDREGGREERKGGREGGREGREEWREGGMKGGKKEGKKGPFQHNSQVSKMWQFSTSDLNVTPVELEDFLHPSQYTLVK